MQHMAAGKCFPFRTMVVTRHVVSPAVLSLSLLPAVISHQLEMVVLTPLFG